ncbi:MAG: PQQ-like beta-propeller repeat protein, partial [Planctomycetales bacterium]
DAGYQWGFASSPLLYRDLVVVQCDSQKDSFIAAFHADTGEEIWKTSRDEIPTWGTPTIHEIGDAAVIMTNGTRAARGYDARTGKELWKLTGFSEISVPTPFVARGLMFLCSGYRPIHPIYAVRTSALGDVSLNKGQSSNEHIAWSVSRGGPYLPTPLVYGDHLYVCSNSGVLVCREATTGKRIYQERISGQGAKSFTASPVAADGKLFFTSEEGFVVVVHAGPTFQLLGVNPLGESCLATPAISEGLFLFRSQRHLIAVGEPPTDEKKTRPGKTR